MSEITDPFGWVQRAEEDYAAALSAVTYVACFHAQQCAKTYLKAILIAKRVAFSRTHNLLLLNDQCKRAGVLLGLDAKSLNTLSDYAVKVRYPGDDPTPEQAREALAIARTVRHFVRAYLGVK